MSLGEGVQSEGIFCYLIEWLEAGTKIFTWFTIDGAWTCAGYLTLEIRR